MVEEFEHSRTTDVVVGIQVDERSVFVIEGDPELDGETPDDVDVEIWGQHCVVEGFNWMIFFHTLKERFKILDLWS